MKKPIASLVVLCILVAVSEEVAATLVLPDEEFEFAAVTNNATQAIALVSPPLAPMGFYVSGDIRETKDGRFRAIFERGDRVEVVLMGHRSCVHVGIYTSGGKAEARELRQSLVRYLRASAAKLQLFEASGCEKEL